MKDSVVIEKTDTYDIDSFHPKGHIMYLVGTVEILDLGTNDKKVEKTTEGAMQYAFEVAALKSHFRMHDGMLMVFDGNRYVPTPDYQLVVDIKEVMTQIGIATFYIASCAKGIASHIIDRVSSRRIYVPKRNLVSFKNGVLDLDSMVLHKHSPRFHTHIYLDYDYDPRAKSDNFRKFLTETLPNEKAQMVIQEFVGCMFIDRKKIKMEKALYMIGVGRNGKGVLTSLIEAIAGAENRTSFQFYDLIKGKNKDYNIAMADGKLVNICADMKRDDVSGGEFKTYVSGEPMDARHIYGRPFIATNPPILIASMNDLPTTSDYSLGHSERTLIVRFNNVVKGAQIDPELTSKLLREISGVFNWVAEGRKRFLEAGGHFTYCEDIEKEKIEAKHNSNSVMRFLRDMYIEPAQKEYNKKELVSIDDLFMQYREYCTSSKIDKAFTKQRMGVLLVNDGYVRVRRSRGAHYWIYRRYDFNYPEFQDDIDEDELKMDSLPF